MLDDKRAEEESSSAEEEHEDQEPEVDVTQLTGRKKKLFELRLKMNEARKLNQTDVGSEKKKMEAPTETKGISKQKKIGKILDTQEAAETKGVYARYLQAKQKSFSNLSAARNLEKEPKEIVKSEKNKNPGRITPASNSRLSPLPPEPVGFDYGRTLDIPLDQGRSGTQKGIKCISYSLRYGEEMMDLQDNQTGFSNLSEGINLEKKIANSLDSLESKHVKSKSSIFHEERDQPFSTSVLSRPLISCQPKDISSVLEARKVKISFVCPSERFDMSKIAEFAPISLKESFGGSSRIKEIGKQTGVSISTYVDIEEKITLRLTSYEHMTTNPSPIIEASIALLPPLCKKVRREFGRHEVALFLKDKHKDSLDEAEVNKLSVLHGARVQIRRVAEGNWHVEVCGAKLGFNRTFRAIVSLLRTVTFFNAEFQEKGTLSPKKGDKSFVVVAEESL